MKKKLVVFLLLTALVMCFAGGFAPVSAVVENAETEEETNNDNLPQTPVSISNNIIEELTGAVNELMETLWAYIELLQELIAEIIYDRETEPDPVEEPVSPPADETPVSGVVEGNLLDESRQPLSGLRVALGNREALTDRNGFFYFEDVAFGSHELHLSDAETGEDIFLTGFSIDENNPRYRVNLIVSLPDTPAEEEIVVSPEPVEELPQPLPGGNLFLFLVLLLLIIVIIFLVILRRRHLRVVDIKTGKTLDKQKIKVYPRTTIDLTEAFIRTSGASVRVQFLKPVRKKLSGCRVLFLNEEEIVDKIEEYTGELEHTVKLPGITEETAGEAEEEKLREETPEVEKDQSVARENEDNNGAK